MTVNTPFLLDDPNKIWLIDQGNINVYTVKLKDGQPEGKRYFFFDAGTQQILMGMPFHESDYNVGFSADASEESIVYEFSLPEFREFLAKDNPHKAAATKLVVQWIENLLYGISENDNHLNKQADWLIEAGQRLILRKAEAISTQRKLVWGKISANKIESVMINGISHIHANGSDIMMPISRRSYLESDRNVGIRFYDSDDALLEDAAWEGLRCLYQTIIKLEQEDIEHVQRNEEALLKERYKNQFRRTRQSLKDVRAILDKKAVDKYAEHIHIYTEDALFNACQVVANLQGIGLTPPLNMSETDPLGDITRASKIRYREVLLKKNWWNQDSGALLGFLKEDGTPIAIIPQGNKSYEIYNPSSKTTIPIEEDNAELIDQVAYTFYQPFPEKKLSVLDIIKFGIFNDTRDFYLLITMGIAATVLGLITPILTGLVYDVVIPNASRYGVVQIGFALMMALLGYVLFELTESYALLRIETKMDHRLQAAVWDRLLGLPTSFFRKYTTGDLADRAMGINEIRRMLSGVVVTSILGSIFSVLNFFLLFYYSIILALVACVLVFIEIIIIYFLGRWQVSKERLVMEYEGKTQGLVLQLLTGISKFRITGTEIRAFTHWLNHFSRAKNYSFQALHIQNIQTVVNAVSPILFTGVIYITLMQTSAFEYMTTGQFLAFSAAYGAFTGAMIAMSEALLTVYQIFPIYERTRPILHSLPEADKGKANPGFLKGNIEVSQVNFRYDDDGPLVLQDVSFKLEAGDYVAFVGPSGSGKSTLVRLLLGFEKPESGVLFFDDQELNQLDIRLVRRQIGTVLQEGQLTPGDIYSNIVGSAPHLNMEDAWEAAKMAAMDDDIKHMPMGMHTIINEGSTTLSGGQKQRLLIAQTLVRKPRIVIFDEATSALDNRTQAVITHSLNNLQATRIVIAHRLSTIRNVDKIIVFDKGRVVQTGSYEELMAVEGPFRNLAARQIE